jgi:hypothetical protein
MPNDAKLGLVLGVAGVVLIAVIFFRKDSAQAQPVLASPPNAPAPELPAAPRFPSSIPVLPPQPTSPADNDIPALPPPPTFSDQPLTRQEHRA